MDQMICDICGSARRTNGCANLFIFAHFTARKLNVREIFLLKRGAKIRLRELKKRVKDIFFA